MKTISNAPACLLTALLIAAGAAQVRGAAPALQGQMTARPLTPQDIKTYGLTNYQGASGLFTVGLGQPVYLEALINKAVPATNILSVTWALTNKPIGSVADLGPSPLGTNVPTYKKADQVSMQIAGRMYLRPDVAGQYTVLLTIVTGDSGSTNIVRAVNAGTYVGAATCALCHSGGVLADNTWVPWSQTPHATFFTRAIDGLESDHYNKNCISCHLVGYDTNTNAVNGGFDDIAKQLGWTFPTVLTNGNWAAMPSQLQGLANIQCENCHGPGSEHVAALGNTNLSNWPRIGKTFAAGDCAQCHDSLNVHYRSAEWNNSRHAVATRTPSGPSRAACVRCHTAEGFADYVEKETPPHTDYEAITCSACHDPHDASNPYQLRVPLTVTLAEGTTVTNAGSGAMCMNCHQSRTGSVTNSLVNYPIGKPTWAGGSSFGPHDNAAADMLEGVNGYNYGQTLPSSSHRFAVTNTCAGCHMQPVTSPNPAFTKAGGHTFGMAYTVVTNGVTNVVDMVAVCVKCHGEIEEFNVPRGDYNGDGVIEGVQTEVKLLLNKLSTLLPNSTYQSNGIYVADGLVKTSISVKTNWPAKFLQAGWNWQFVNTDGSLGVHNAPYAVGLLRAAIGDLTGDGNNDGLPDAWQTQYFGSANDPKAAPNATPAGDGVPNWLKYSLGLDPTVPGLVVPGGVVWASGTTVGNPAGTNDIAIYTAAEVAFSTEVGKTYQIQEVSSLSQGWKNVGTPIQGTGETISYVTPTRNNVQQYFRVIPNP